MFNLDFLKSLWFWVPTMLVSGALVIFYLRRRATAVDQTPAHKARGNWSTTVITILAVAVAGVFVILLKYTPTKGDLRRAVSIAVNDARESAVEGDSSLAKMFDEKLERKVVAQTGQVVHQFNLLILDAGLLPMINEDALPDTVNISDLWPTYAKNYEGRYLIPQPDSIRVYVAEINNRYAPRPVAPAPQVAEGSKTAPAKAAATPASKTTIRRSRLN